MARTRYPYVQRRKRSDGTIGYRGYDACKPRNYSATFTTEEEAHAAAMRMRGEAASTAPAYSLDDGIEALKADLRVKRTAGTVRWYSDHLRAVCELIPGETWLHRINRETIEQFIRDRLRVVEGQRRVKPQTVNADLRALHRVFAIAIRQGVVRENPVRQVDRPRADAPAIDWFRDDELAALLPMLTPHARDVVQFFAMTGIRRSEAARLAPSSVRAKMRQLVVAGKTRTRVVPLSPALDAVCARLLAKASADHLFPGGTHALDELFRDAKEACGDRRLHMHSCRHTFCTWLIRSGVRVDVVMRLADHRDIKTTMRYLHEVGSEGVDAVARLRLVQPDESGPAAQG
jgi:site-specific recombinase XerD